jgi:hypothetical protein
MSENDRRLREAFASLRREEQAHAPPLERVLARRPSSRRVVAAPAYALAAAVAVVAVVAALALRPPRPEPAMSLAEWTEPTAFLLRTPGSDLLTTVPQFARPSPMNPPRSPSP